MKRRQALLCVLLNACIYAYVDSFVFALSLPGVNANLGSSSQHPSQQSQRTRSVSEYGHPLYRSSCMSTNCLGAQPHNDDPSGDGSRVMLRVARTITSSPGRSLYFSILISLCGAALGPFLDSYHSAFGVLQYDVPITAKLWGANAEHPALITAWWVPELFGLAGFLIGWLYVTLDAALESPQERRRPSPPLILTGISFFTFQYWLSGVLYASGIDRGTILNVMTITAAAGFVVLDLTEAGLWTSLATAVGGPLIETGLITLLVGKGGYHYTDGGETGFFPLWIVPVYFLGGPAVGNLSRGFWNALSPEENDVAPLKLIPCKSCKGSRCIGCPNCDAQGYYMSYGRKVACPACRSRGLVICRECFNKYGEDPNDIEAIRFIMEKMPD